MDRQIEGESILAGLSSIASGKNASQGTIIYKYTDLYQHICYTDICIWIDGDG